MTPHDWYLWLQDQERSSILFESVRNGSTQSIVAGSLIDAIDEQVQCQTSREQQPEKYRRGNDRPCVAS